MNQYYTKLDKRLLSDDLCESLVKYSMDNILEFKANRSTKEHMFGTPDGNHYIDPFELVKHYPELMKFKSSFNLKFVKMPSIYMVKPNSVVPPHRDNHRIRRANLVHSLYPRADYPPTYFYTPGNSQPVCELDYSDDLPVIMNVYELHGLENNSNDYRLNIQFGFIEPYEEIVELYKKGMLFKQHPYDS